MREVLNFKHKCLIQSHLSPPPLAPFLTHIQTYTHQHTAGNHLASQGKLAGALLTDISKAFDCLNHELLIAKLDA